MPSGSNIDTRTVSYFLAMDEVDSDLSLVFCRNAPRRVISAEAST